MRFIFGRDKTPTPKTLTYIVAACFMPATAFANPTGGVVANGAATFDVTGNTLTVTNTPGAIINWQSFSIASGEMTRFLQQSASSAVLNRVLGADPSVILGALQSNGRVFLINPNGVVFGAGAQIDVAGLVASSLNLSNADFLAGRLKFSGDGTQGTVVNSGTITGNSVYLIASSVENNGIINSPNGEVVLAAGHSVELVNAGSPNLRVEISAPDGQAVNLGKIIADAGNIGVYGALVQNSGTISASSAVAEGGHIYLKATQNVNVSGTVSADGATNGGSVTIQAGSDSGDTAMVQDATVIARGNAGSGGTVEVLGNQVGLVGDTTVDLSGATGGGTALIGGDEHGSNPDIPNAYRTYVGADVNIKADALNAGNGGKVIVWADGDTRFYGNISAQAGIENGDGGFSEVSGANYLDFEGLVDLAASNGADGTLLLDPADVEIGSSDGVLGIVADILNGGSFSAGDPDVFAGATQLQAPSEILWGTIQTLLNNANVVITTRGTGGNTGGDITIVDSGTLSSTSANNPNNSLTLLANNNITINSGANVELDGGGSLTLVAGWVDNNDNASITAPTVAAGTGDINVYGNLVVSDGALALKAGNNIVFDGTNGSVVANGLGSVDLEAGNNIDLTYANVVATGAADGASAIIGLTATNGAINISNSTLTASAGAGGNAQIDLNAVGIDVTSSDLIANGSGATIAFDAGGAGASFTSNDVIHAVDSDGGEAGITLTHATDVTIDGSTFQADGGEGVGGSAYISLAGSGDLIVEDGAQILANGGSNDAGIGGIAKIALSGASVTVSSLLVGGEGNSNASISIAATGGSGVTGGAASVAFTSSGGAIQEATEDAITAQGGSGTTGDGGDASVTFASNGGDIALGDLANSIYGDVHAYGGASDSGNGGAGSITANAGIGTVSVNYYTYVFADGGESSTGTGGDATIDLKGGGITIVSSVNNEVISSGGAGGVGGAASVTLDAGSGVVSISGANDIEADGGEGGEGAGGVATVSLTGDGITISGDGGEGGNDSVSAYGGSGATGGAANVTLDAGSGVVSISSASDIEADGGEASNGAGGAATIMLAGSGFALTGDSDFNPNVYASGGNSDAGGAGGDAVITWTGTGGDVAITDAYVEADGGTSADSAGGDATVTFASNNGNININGANWGGGIYVYGGNAFGIGDGGTGTIALNAGSGAINIGSASDSSGDDELYAYGGNTSANGGNAGITLNTTGTVSIINGSIQSYGGSAFDLDDVSGNGGNASVNIIGNETHADAVTLNDGAYIDVEGGSSADATGGSANAGIDGSSISADGSNNEGSLFYVLGGSGSSAYGDATLTLNSSGTLTLTNAEADVYDGNATSTLIAGGLLTLDDAYLNIEGTTSANANLTGVGVTLRNNSEVYAETDQGATSIAIAGGSGAVNIIDASYVEAYGGIGGDATIALSGNSLTVDGGENGGYFFVYAHGGTMSSGEGVPQTGTGAATITWTGTGGAVSIQNAGMEADGGEAVSVGTTSGSGSITLTSGGGDIVLGGDQYGAGIVASSANAYGGSSSAGDGGNASVTFNAGSGAISISNAASDVGSYIGAFGGNTNSGNDGGNATVALNTTGDVTVANSSQMIAQGGAGYQNTGGDATLTIGSATTSAGVVTLNQAIMDVVAGSAIGPGGAANAGIYGSAININLTGAEGAPSVDVQAGSDDGGDLSDATLTLQSGGGITVSGVNASSLDGFGVYGGDALTKISASGAITFDSFLVDTEGTTSADIEVSGASVSIANTVGTGNAALYAYGAADGATSKINVTATSGTIDINGSELEAVDTDASTSDTLTLNASGLITLTDTYLLSDGLLTIGNHAGVTVDGGYDYCEDGCVATMNAAGIQIGNAGDSGALTFKATDSNLDIESSGALALFGGDINVGSADSTGGYVDISSSGTLTVGATGSLNVTGSSYYAYLGGGGAGVSLAVNGNVNVMGGSGTDASADIYGNPEVNATVGGVINIASGTGDGAYARIEAGTPNTINVTFPNLTSGGYTVDDVAQISNGNSSGFYEQGQVATLNQNLFFIYGGGASSSSSDSDTLQQVTQYVYSVINTSSGATDQNNTSSGGKEGSPSVEHHDAQGDDTIDSNKNNKPVCS